MRVLLVFEVHIVFLQLLVHGVANFLLLVLEVQQYLALEDLGSHFIPDEVLGEVAVSISNLCVGPTVN